MKLDRELVGEAIFFEYDFSYQRVLEEAIDRIENPNVDEDVYEALDDALIWYSAQWTIMKHHQNPSEANLDLAYKNTIEDLYRYIELFNAKYGKVNSR